MASATPKKTDETVISIPPIEVKTYVIRLVGDSPLMTHAWSEKAKGDMRRKQGGEPSPKKEPKNPQKEYEAATYRLQDGTCGIPAIAFKLAAVSAARHVEGLTMTYLYGVFHVVGENVAIEGEPEMREDMVKVGPGMSKVADLRYRPIFHSWAANLTIRINSRALTLEQLVHLFNQAGFSVGVGEWRPEKKGDKGMFHVEGVQEVAA